jgi:hypothetical protein
MSHVCVNTAKTTLLHMLASFHYMQLELGVRGFFLIYLLLYVQVS